MRIEDKTVALAVFLMIGFVSLMFSMLGVSVLLGLVLREWLGWWVPDEWPMMVVVLLGMAGISAFACWNTWRRWFR